MAFLQARARGNCMSRSITDMIADAVVRLFSGESLCYTGQALILAAASRRRPVAKPNNKQGPEFEVESFMRAQLHSPAIDPNRTLVRV